MRTLRSLRYAHAIALCGLLLLIVSPSTAADTREAAPTTLYRLDGPSAYLSGCIEGLCLCPVRFEYLAGTFGLTAVGTTGEFRVYTVSDIDWFTHAYGDSRSQITGSGTYLLGDETQQLVLDLQVGDADSITVDSGVVPLGVTFPAIDIGALTGGICYQEGVDIVAAPATLSIEMSMAAPTMVTWSVAPEAMAYDLMAGDLLLLRATGGDFTASSTVCIASNVTVPSMSIAYPADSNATWFLVRGLPQPGFDSAGDGQIGSRDAEILASPASCP